MSGIITLTTDFGLEDEYAGVMKGVILARAPEATVVDLSHAIERQNIRQAALLIESAHRYFPAGTVHLVVVDPGVGGDRKLIVLQAAGQLFLAPDNGVLGLLLEPENFQGAHELQCPQFYVAPLSSTFHGRDILAPVAAQLVRGLDPAATGPAVERQKLKKLRFAAAKIDSHQAVIAGEVTGKDHFGNLRTNIDAESLHCLFGKEIRAVRVSLQNEILAGIQETFGDKAPGELLAIIGSRGVLEIAVNLGNAADLLNAVIGDEVRVELR